MRSTRLLSALAAATALTVSTAPARADIVDFVAGAIASQAYNHFVRNRAANQAPAASTESSKSPGVSRARQSNPSSDRAMIPATEEGRAVQEALNFFGFDAGTVDGRIGPQSREAISAYQDFMGYPSDGELDATERGHLVEAFERAQAGDLSAGQAASDDMEARVMLKEPGASQGTRMAAGDHPAGLQQASLRQSPSANEIVSLARPPAAGTTLVNLFAPPPAVGASLASHCADTSLLTATNGFSSGAASNGAAALSEQFCLARAYAIRDGADLAAGIGVPADRIAASCAAYGEEMRPHVAALTREGRDEVLEGVGDLVRGTGIAAPDLAATATVCLSEGYRTDDMGVALGSALILASLDQDAYGELMGHHLALGFGVPAAPERATEWYEAGLSAAEDGRAVFAPGQPERTGLIRKAVASLPTGREPAQSGSVLLPVLLPLQ
ncbi:putative peptidoglycan binding protein [Palleronia aestuarii]|uniref:Putative peptidoglycan binding protein n=1 Tax=Palleronia aestuarii TaxID=568105 RepID=A0A2W7NHR1_9RHOB|nr:peptidoglycan-binding domain-containing protein [Palleronia aestuarii]PZX17767.1 putative peptidoglycan binding protein [Palleronia aestuarii]